MTAMTFYRLRQMQFYHDSNNPELYDYVRSLYRTEMISFKQASDQLFAYRDSSSDYYYTTPLVLVNVSYYPYTSNKVLQNFTLYQVTNTFAEAGLQISNIEFAAFQNISTNNDARFILDNMFQIQHQAYDFSMNTLYFGHQAGVSTQATNLVYILTGISVVIVALFMYLIDLKVRGFKRKQSQSLDVFQAIPERDIRETLETIHEYTEICLMTILTSDSLKRQTTKYLENVPKGKFISTSSTFGIQYGIYAVSLTAIMGIFAYLNVLGVYNIGMGFAVLDQNSDMITYSIRSYLIQNELVNIDLKTWERVDLLRSDIVFETNWYFGVYQTVLYGDNTRYPPSPSSNNVWPDMQTYFNSPACLLQNVSQCSLPNPPFPNPGWNTSIEFTIDTVNSGILYASAAFMNVVLEIANLPTTQTLMPNPSKLLMLKSILDPYLMQGWQIAGDMAYNLTNDSVDALTQQDIAIFVIEILVLILGQFLIVARMMNGFKFMDNCIFSLTSWIPDRIRQIPEVEAILDRILMRETENANAPNANMFQKMIFWRNNPPQPDIERSQRSMRVIPKKSRFPNISLYSMPAK
ncbi:uncharacterized protein BJ171DRAFT_503559 [Polychytrium aggregatum]|uniref:uncharacterized protein n=1 Tax=Polychytrium aggregatum TaxID=110093 RepID=UPI0022FEFB75|nr:uncharacterized protein BJ171DRAFT_503559 [Polychytrium aggregatum]KAI9204772.1 hypothetical protein BJ171DRAFT_503559 [Polychytrium aggregatum]